MHDAITLVCRISTFKRSSVTSSHARTIGSCNVSICKLSKYWVSWCFPITVQLLTMDNLISLDDFLNNGFRFLFVHLPNFADSVIVAFFESLVLLLKFFEHLSEVFEFLSAFDVFSLELSKLFFILSLDFSNDVLKASLSQSEQLGGLLVDSCSFS